MNSMINRRIFVIVFIICFIFCSACSSKVSQTAPATTDTRQTVKATNPVNESFIPLSINSLDKDKVNVVLNGKKLVFDVQPVVENVNIILAVKNFFEALNMRVDWDGKAQAITATNETYKINIVAGDRTFKVNDKVLTLDSPAKVISGNLFAPIRSVSEGIGMTVDWNDTASVAFVNSGNVSINYSNGKSQYSGQVDSSGKKYGYGKEYSETGKLIYSGQWENNLKSGIGKFTWENMNSYEGEFKNDQIEGFGVLTHLGIGKYYGNFLLGMRNGKGTFVWDNGDKYIGDWTNDKMNGTGSYTFADGTVMSGVWQYNQFMGTKMK